MMADISEDELSDTFWFPVVAGTTSAAGWVENFWPIGWLSFIGLIS